MARKRSINPLSLLFVLLILAYGLFTVHKHGTSPTGTSNDDGEVVAGADDQGADSDFTIPGVTLPGTPIDDLGDPPTTTADRGTTPPRTTPEDRQEQVDQRDPLGTENPPNSIVAGRVVSVIDGDTVDLRVESQTIRVRLDGIDAPERGQAYGTASRDYLGRLCHEQTVYAILTGKDRYGRYIADIYRGEVWVNGEMVKAGYAWHYEQYSDSLQLAELQRQAQSATSGLWSERAPIAPWEYRNRRRSVDPVAGRADSSRK